MVASRILKVSNVVDPVDIYRIGSELQDIQMDMKEEFASYGNLLDIRMVMPKTEALGGISCSLPCSRGRCFLRRIRRHQDS